MMHKTYLRCFLVFSILFSTSHIFSFQIEYPQLDLTKYQEAANDWVYEYILNDTDELLIYPKELQLLANLIYFSFHRSRLTLEAQEIALNSLDAVWQSWQNIAQTRLDPSTNLPYNTHTNKNKKITNKLWTIQQEHHAIGTTYTHAIDLIVDGNILVSEEAEDAVSDMRAQARKVVAQALVDVRNYFGSLFYQKSYRALNKSIPFMDYVWSYLPQLAVNSFVEANKTNDLVSEESWTLLMKIQNVGRRTWEIIETERASFYLAFYKEIMKAFDSAGMDESYQTIMFNQYGQIPLEHQTEYLPKYIDDRR